MRFFATGPRGTEELLAAELRGLGLAAVRRSHGGVGFAGTLGDAYRACLWSRVAGRVLLPLVEFPAADREELYRGVAAVDWDDHVAPAATLAVDVTGTTAGLVDTRFAAQVAKDAVVDQVRTQHGRRPSVDLRTPDVRLNLHLERGRGTLSVDLAGESLHRRGYREPGRQVQAPLKENLAAAVLLAAGWPRLTKGGAALLDPLCGSGTLLVEGGLMAADAAPGLLRRTWGFSGWRGHDAAAWAELRREADERRAAGLARLVARQRGAPRILGFDRDARAVELARQTLRRAGLQEVARVEHRELAELRLPLGPVAEAGLLAANPPYGERLDEPELAGLYNLLGRTLRREFGGWRAAVLVADRRLGARLGLPHPHELALFNGPIRCTLLTAIIAGGRQRPAATPAEPAAGTTPEAEDRAAVDRAAAAAPQQPSITVATPRRTFTGRDLERVFAGLPVEQSLRRAESRSAPTSQPGPDVALHPEEFANRLRRNLRTLGRPLRRAGVSCYRLYDADLPDYNLAVDLYDGWALVQEYAAPAEIDPRKAARRLQAALAAIRTTLELPPERIVLKVRRRQRGVGQYGRLGQEGRVLTVHEHGAAFLVNLSDYLDTGLFLDQRLTRSVLRDLAPGQAFLNLFGYTGAATVSAALGGASRSLTIDLSATYLDWARRNFDLNGLDPHRHRTLQADCLSWLEEQSTPRVRYGLIYLTPPTFSNSKRMGAATLDVQRDHVALIRAAARVLETHGTLVFESNRRGFRIDRESLADFLLADLSRITLPPDFARRAHSHHVWAIRLAAAAEKAGGGDRRGRPHDTGSGPRSRPEAQHNRPREAPRHGDMPQRPHGEAQRYQRGEPRRRQPNAREHGNSRSG